VVTAKPAMEELNEGIPVFLRCIVNRVETNMFFFLFAKIRYCVYVDEILRNFALVKIKIFTKIVSKFYKFAKFVQLLIFLVSLRGNLVLNSVL
jgi:hypothetical protein